MANSVQVINRSSSDDLKQRDIKIEVRMEDLNVLNNYIPNIQHLPGVIEMDVIDSYKMLSRRSDRVNKTSNDGNVVFRTPK